MKYQGQQLENRDNSYKAAHQSDLTQIHENRQSTPDSLILENGNQTISSGYESSECGSSSNVHQADKNVIEIECNHNTTLTEENLSRFMQQVHMIRMDSGSEGQLSESYSNSLIEIKNHNLKGSSDSDRLSFGTVSSCADLTYSDDDEGLSSTSCELPLSPRSYLYPHGIINPNYPGFQHLAHTLSEDYSTHASNCNLSDCGMYRNNYDSKNKSVLSSDDNGNLNVTSDLASPISDSIISSNKEFSNYDHKTHLEQCNLQTYLNHYGNKSDIKLYDEEMDQMNVVSCTPPDILYFKGYDLEVENGGDKPDLIQNVKGAILDGVNDLNDERNSMPPNIVGDFEKEIEKEIVEIVSGYKDIFGDRTTTQLPHTTTPVKDDLLLSTTKIPTNHQPISAFEKIHDATLSNGREAITPNFEMKPIKLPSMTLSISKPTTTKCHQLNNNHENVVTTATTMTPTKYISRAISIKNNNFLQNTGMKHHYNCNFFNAISKNVNRNKTTSFFKPKEWNTNGKTIIKTKDDCGIISIEAPSSVFDFSVIEQKLNSVMRENTDEKKRINHHDEIRRRLQMVEEKGTLKSLLNKGKANRPSLHSRLQNGKNLQICFMNENISDGESPSSDSESCPKLSEKTRKLEQEEKYSTILSEEEENDFFTHQAKLQIEARMALAQAKDMAHLQMELEKQRTHCPVTQIIHNALNRASIQMPEGKRRVSRQLLTEFTVPQLRIIVNELNGNIEQLNENLVQILMERDELHMGQDSMLVDIEDLTRYLAAKEPPMTRQDLSTERFSGDNQFKSSNGSSLNTTDQLNNKVENGTSGRFFRLSSFGKH